MRKSGSPESPYNIAGRAEEQVERLIRSEEPRLQKFSNFCLLLGLIIWGLNWLLGLLWPSLHLNLFSVTDIVLLVAMAHSFVYRKEKQALAFVGAYWMKELILALNTMGSGFAQSSQNFTSSLYGTFSSILTLFFVLYVLAASFEPMTYGRQKFYHTFKPILKLVTVLVLLICVILGVIAFFGGIRFNYLKLSSLIQLLGATLMLAVVSREFDRESWMRPIKRLGPPLFLALLLFFSLIEGILQFALLYKTVALPGFLLFLMPLLKMFFSAVFVVPVYFLLAWGFRYPVRVRATERNHIVGAESTEEFAEEPNRSVAPVVENQESPQEPLYYEDPVAQTYNPLQGAEQPHEAWMPLGTEAEAVTEEPTLSTEVQHPQQEQELERPSTVEPQRVQAPETRRVDPVDPV